MSYVEVLYILICFNIRLDAVVCIDACFGQKRNKNKKDPHYRDCPRTHSDSSFLSEEEVKAMEEYVATHRAGNSAKGTQSNNDDDHMDGFEHGMKVPSSVLNDCGNSFKAADEKREKASTQFFADTGLMEMLCQHDHVLWLVNMTHAGERQHYALALLHKLFEHIPSDMTVGLLYDVACNLHRSCLKWGFLNNNLHRITFCHLCISCIWSPVALSDCLPSKKVCRIWTYRWRRL